MKLLTPFVATPELQPAAPALTETPEELIALKERFAELTLRNEPFAAALVLFPDDTGRALRVANEWPQDEQVKTLRQSFIDAEDDGETAFLPTKAEAARLAWNIARDADKMTEDRLKAIKLYSEIRGFIERPQVAVTNTVNQVNRVLIVKDHGSDDEWETQLRKQQKRLINGEYT